MNLGLLRSSSRFHSRWRPLSKTSVFVQNGIKIREVPHVVRRVRESLEGKSKIKIFSLAPPVNFDLCSDVFSVMKTLEVLPESSVDSRVALGALQKLSNLNCKPDTFGSISLYTGLWNKVYATPEVDVLVEALSIPQDYDRSKLIIDEMFLRLQDFNLNQVLKAIPKVFDLLASKNRTEAFEETDKFWSYLMDRVSEITSKNLSNLFGILPRLKDSRELILKISEDKLIEHWRSLNTTEVLSILSVVTTLDGKNGIILDVITSWILVNIQNLSEEDLSTVIFCFTELGYCNFNFVKVLEKYISGRGLCIKDPNLVASICDYAFKFRRRSAPILEGSGEYFIENGKNLNPSQIYRICRIFGELNFHPPNGFKFFDVLEEILCQKFDDFNHKEIVKLLLGCSYLEKFPLNFVDRIYSSKFLALANNDVFFDKDLRLLDAVLRIETPSSYKYSRMSNVSLSYRPLKRNYRIFLDAKIATQFLSKIVGGTEKLNNEVLLAGLPLNELYVVDIMVYPSSASKFIRLGKYTKNDSSVAVIFHPLEHYDSTGKHLLGSQVMRIRHLKTMNFKVVEIDSKRLHTPRTNPNIIAEYVRLKYEKAFI